MFEQGSLDEIALDKRISQARERVAHPATTDSEWTVQLLGYLADEAENALTALRGVVVAR
jgi:hypothetical protein